MPAIITQIDSGSPGHKAGIRQGDILLAINGHRIRDVLDYKFYAYDRSLEILLKRGEDELCLALKKPEGRDLGLSFASYLMDKEKSCSNKCVFCFIDQLPLGMRETLYYKDDDARLSFLTGNYITMTNLGDRDVQRIIDMKVSPLNISVHTTDPELRNTMLGNRRGGESLQYLIRFARAGLTLNTQIVVCPGLNDGAALEKTLADLSAMGVSTVAVVPVGLTQYRKGLHPLESISREGAGEIIDMIDNCRRENEASGYSTLCAASDELYLLAGRSIPPEAYYGSFEQLDNGVGLMRLFRTEVEAALRLEEEGSKAQPFSIVTGKSGFIGEMIDLIGEKCNNLVYDIYEIDNVFFGAQVNVTGLVTGGDILAQLKGKIRYPRLLVPQVMLRHGETVFLDDISVEDLETILDVKVEIVPMDGGSLVDAVLGYCKV